MKILHIALAMLLTAGIITGCMKENSFEDPIGGQGTGPVIGNNCIIKTITEFDTISQTGLAAINFDFNVTNSRLNTLVEFDSIGQNVILTAFFQHNADTIRIDVDQFFIVDASGRVTKFVGREDPYDPLSQLFEFVYTYDAGGRLTRRTVADPLISSSPFLQSDYAYSGNNMTGISVKLTGGGLTIPLQNITLGYQFDRVPRNYMNMLPDCNELAPYVGALNMGQKAINPVNKIQIISLNPLTGTPIDTTTTLYTKYNYSRDGYVLSVDMAGDDIPAIPLAAGRNNFAYFCR